MESAQSILIIDLGSGSVGISLAERTPGGGVRVSHTLRMPIRNIAGTHTSAFASLALQSVQRGLETLGAVTPRPERAHIFFAAPWYKALIRDIDLKSKDPLRITHATLRKAVTDYTEHHSPATSSGARAIESIVSQAYVNEYPTTIRTQLRGTALRAALYESFCDTPFADSVTEAIHAVFPRLPLAFHTFLFAFFAVMRDVAHIEHGILLDVGGEITDIAVVNRGCITYASSFPVGSLSMLRTLANSGSMADAASRLTLFANGELSESEAKTFGGKFDAATTPWRDGYAAAIRKALTTTPVSGTVYLSADPESLPWLQETITRADVPLAQRSVGIPADFFSHQVQIGNSGVYDAFIALESLYSFTHADSLLPEH
ncbi:MAG: hypothetical protein KGI73_02645 [Patescibacteria group bacterium]|nr:hypothetical protein [Patescibacteria group bacterium]